MGYIDNPNESDYDKLERRVAILEGASPLGWSSITRGSLRVASVEGLIIEGSERVDGTLVVHGTEEVDGLLRVTGTLIVSGTASITGPTSIEGATAITGTTSIEGATTVTGPMSIEGTLGIEGDTTVTGDLTVSGDGLIHVGSMVLDPTLEGGAVGFENGGQVFTDATTIQLYLGNSVAQISNDYARIQHGGSVIEINAEGVRISTAAIPNTTDPSTGDWLQQHRTTGYLQRVAPGIGGPGSGSWEWPFPESTITWGFRPPERPTHDGIDFAGPEVTGHPVRAAAQGVVAFAGWSAGYGWYVDLAHSPIDGQTVLTRYGHMLDPGPAVSTGDSVPKLGVLGTVGDTGASEGEHLHWELHLDGDPVDPAPFMAVHAA